MRTTTKQWCERNGSKLIRLGWRHWVWEGDAAFVLFAHLKETDLALMSYLFRIPSRKLAERALDEALLWWREVGR